MDCSLPSSSVLGIFQARIVEWVAVSYARGSSRPRDRTRVSCLSRQIIYHWATLVNRVLEIQLLCEQFLMMEVALWKLPFMFSFQLWFVKWCWVSVQFSHSVLSDSATPWTEARHASLSITDSGQVRATFAYNHKNSFWDTKKPLFYPEMYFCSLQHFSFNILASPKCVLWNINPVEY